MANIPKSIDTLNKVFKPEDLANLQAKHGVTNVHLASIRSIRFDFPAKALPDGTKVNRVKITARDDGSVDLHLIEVIDHDLIGGVAPDGVKAVLATILGMEI